MTIAQVFSYNTWGQPFIPGSSTQLAELTPKEDDFLIWNTPQRSTGTSSSAATIEKYLSDMIMDKYRWLSLSTKVAQAVEEEVIVLMPSKKLYSFDIEVTYLGHAKPLISIDEIGLDMIED